MTVRFTRLSPRLTRRSLVAGLGSAALFGSLPAGSARAQGPLKVGTSSGPVAEIMQFAAEHAKKNEFAVQVVEFSDWITPNEAVANGDIDTNLFQHKPFLNAAIKARGYKLSPVAPTYVLPVGLFSKKIKAASEVANGATVAILNDPVNAARGLRLYEKAGLIKLKPNAGEGGTLLDIVDNPRRLKFLELEAPAMPRALEDLAIAQLSYAYVRLAKLDPETALVSDGIGDPYYVLEFVARTDRKDDPRILRFASLFRSPEVKDYIVKNYGKYIVPLW